MKSRYISVILLGLVVVLLSGCLEQTATQEKKEEPLFTENALPQIQECKTEYYDRWNSGTVYFVAYAYDPDGNVTSYRWRLSDGYSTTEQSFVHTFQQPGMYHAELMVTDNEGAVNSTEIVVDIQGSSPGSSTHDQQQIIGIWKNPKGNTIEFTTDGYYLSRDNGNETRDRYWFSEGGLFMYSTTTSITIKYTYHFEGTNTLVFYPYSYNQSPDDVWTRQ